MIEVKVTDDDDLLFTVELVHDDLKPDHWEWHFTGPEAATTGTLRCAEALGLRTVLSRVLERIPSYGPTARRINPPIPGHTLLNEGHVSLSMEWRNRLRHITSAGSEEPPRSAIDGGCQCGALPDRWRTMSQNQIKAWHREHKAAIRSGVL